MPGVPTFLVVDATTEKVVLSRASGLDRAQLLAMLDDGERAARGGSGEADAAFEKGQALAAGGKHKEAAGAFERALVGTPLDWPRRRTAIEALLLARAESGDLKGCVELAERESRSGAHDAWWAGLVASGLSCAVDGKLPLEALEKRARSALAQPDLDDDDRSSLYEVMWQATHDQEVAAGWLAFLEKRAAVAPTAEARAAYDPHRLEAAIALGDPARAVPALEASERDLPGDYNGPARLAIAYLEMGRYDDSLAASERALKKVYGPRRLRVQETRAKALRKKGDVEGARSALEQAIAEGEALPKSDRSAAGVARLKLLLKEIH
jgi:tetratricopeptide (TPR) repeat protein